MSRRIEAPAEFDLGKRFTLLFHRQPQSQDSHHPQKNIDRYFLYTFTKAIAEWACLRCEIHGCKWVLFSQVLNTISLYLVRKGVYVQRSFCVVLQKQVDRSRRSKFEVEDSSDNEDLFLLVFPSATCCDSAPETVASKTYIHTVDAVPVR